MGSGFSIFMAFSGLFLLVKQNASSLVFASLNQPFPSTTINAFRARR